MSEKLLILRTLYENSSYTTDVEVFHEVIEKAVSHQITVSIRSLKSYKKEYLWYNPNIRRQPIKAIEKASLKPDLQRDKNIVDKAKKKVAEEKDLPKEAEPRIDAPVFSPAHPENQIILEERITQVMQWLLQGASKDRIYKQFKKNGVEIQMEQVSHYIQEAYNVYQNVAPQQRETILGLNLERLNSLISFCYQDIASGKNRPAMMKLVLSIISEMNMMFGIKGLNLNINNEQGISERIAGMTKQEKYDRLIHLKQKNDGSFSE